LGIVRGYQKELGEAVRSARRQRRGPSRGRRGMPVPRVLGLRLKLGRLLIVVGTTLKEDERPCPDMARS
jgi:hypothetical protein